MLESLNARPRLPPGGARQDARRAGWPPSRRPGELAIPFTTGILVGHRRVPGRPAGGAGGDRRRHRRHGHVQEVIVQNFLPKAGTAMHARAAVPAATSCRGRVAAARLVLPADVHLQAPPNLSDDLGRPARRRASTTGAGCRR